MTGTMWHSYFEGLFNAARLPVMTEVKLDRWLPEGWSGTADWLIWNDDLKAFVLGDLKTIKGEGMKYVQYEGIKKEHLWQASAYWHALFNMGLPLVKGFFIYYLPQNVPPGEQVEPSLQEGMPLDREIVVGAMEARWAQTKLYLSALGEGSFINEYLAPEQERVQIVRWNKARSVWDVKLAPHWSAAYCPYPDELCSCRHQGTEKIGEYVFVQDGEELDWANLEFQHRAGYDIEPTVEPDPKDVIKIRKELYG